jgi:Fur family transcriptional regulator, ferric uptake regulator
MQIENDFQIAATQAAPSAETMLAALTQAGHSNTAARRAVIAAVCEAGGQASPATLLALGRAHHPALGLVTVYRTLDVLLELGFVRKLHLDDGCHSYAAATHDHGHHIICQQCQRAIEFDGCDMDGLIAAVEAQTGYQVRGHWLEMFGLCPECRAAVAGDGGNDGQELRNDRE